MPTHLAMAPITPSANGVHKEMTRLEVGWGAYANTQNVLRRHGKFRNREGITKFADDTSGRVMGFVAYDTADARANIVAGTATGMFYYDSATNAWMDITEEDNELTGTTNNLAVMRAFECDAYGEGSVTAVVLVNGKDAPKIWDNESDVYQDITGAPPVAKCAVVCMGRLVLGNDPDVSPAAVDYSAYLDPNDGWGVNELILGDTAGPIVAMKERGNLAFAVYKTDAIYEGQGSQGGETFTFSAKALDIPGPCSPLAVVSNPEGLHLYLASDGGIYMYDGVQPKLLGEHVREFLSSDLDTDKMGRVFGFYDQRHACMWFFYPKSGFDDIQHAVMVDVNSNSVWPMYYPNHSFSAGVQESILSSTTLGDLTGRTLGSIHQPLSDFSVPKDRIILGSTTGQCYYDLGNTDDGDSVPIIIETGLDDFKAPGDYKTVTSSDHLFLPTSDEQSVSIQIGTSNFGEEPVYDTAQSVSIQTEGPFEFGHRVTGRAISMKITADCETEVQWKQSRLGVANRGKR